ncbi:MAG: hypothetical protein LBI48_01930 [Burkholderiaceae bacterium]|jgi:hypothetical protein|nr:hypothetical protein [Burkholderiaceae bacterium]
MTKTIKTSEILRSAKKYHLWWGEDFTQEFYNEHICHAINSTPRGYHPKAAFIIKIIMYRLCPHGDVASWLKKTANISPKLLTHKNIQAYRHRWLAALIAEYEAKGD